MTGWKYPDGGGWRPGTPPTKPDPTNPTPVPDILCGINGCVYLKDHGKEPHSWEHN